MIKGTHWQVLYGKNHVKQTTLALKIYHVGSWNISTRRILVSSIANNHVHLSFSVFDIEPLQLSFWYDVINSGL